MIELFLCCFTCSFSFRMNCALYMTISIVPPDAERHFVIGTKEKIRVKKEPPVLNIYIQ